MLNLSFKLCELWFCLQDISRRTNLEVTKWEEQSLEKEDEVAQALTSTKNRKRKTKRKDNPNQLSINEINALQVEQSNWGKKKSLFVFLFLFFVDVDACAASSSFYKLCSSHFITSRSVLPEMSWWQNHNSQSLKDNFNTLLSKLNHGLDRILH